MAAYKRFDSVYLLLGKICSTKEYRAWPNEEQKKYNSTMYLNLFNECIL